MDQAANQQTAGQDARGGKPSSVVPGRAFRRDPRMVAPVVAASVAVFLAAPWLDERLVWAEWFGVAAGLALVRHLRGFRGEGWSLVRGGATVLVSLVNGNSFTTPRTLVQHRQLAQLRAVECRRSLVRCAATGQTCVISPAGKIVAVLPLHARGMLEATVPLIDAVTFASRAGPLFPLGCAALAAMLVVGRWRARLTSRARTPDI